MKKTEEQQLARDLYFQTELPQAEIARRTGVSEKTVYLWIREGKWQQLRAAARRMPSMLVEQYFDQLTEMNSAIAQREHGERYATPKEAETMRKLLACVTTVQKQMSCAAQTEVLMGYIGHVMKKDHELAKQMVMHGDDYLKGKAVNGYEPYEIGYSSNPNEDAIADEIVNAHTQPGNEPEIETQEHDPNPSLRGAPGPEAPSATEQSSDQVTNAAENREQPGNNPEIEIQEPQAEQTRRRRRIDINNTVPRGGNPVRRGRYTRPLTDKEYDMLFRRDENKKNNKRW